MMAALKTPGAFSPDLTSNGPDLFLGIPISQWFRTAAGQHGCFLADAAPVRPARAQNGSDTSRPTNPALVRPGLPLFQKPMRTREKS